MKSQWNFGELFPPEQTGKVFSVTELTGKIRALLERDFLKIAVVGEITNLRAQASGHMYFTVKDAAAQLSCVLFRGEAQADRSLLQDGQKVILRGDITVYEPRGKYQLRVTGVELQGIGALQAAFEKLKRKLNAEGLFAPERKRALPRFPRRIGVVTSPTGAAIRDVCHVVARRNPMLNLVLAPCRVQGEGAAAEIAAAIRLLNDFDALQRQASPGSLLAAPLDLILVTRGGGSLEDLWAFNEEVVARAIFESALPVVSAVGHEIDFTISDFVADVRAATPSAAAEILTEGVYASRPFIEDADQRLRQLVTQQLDGKVEAWSQAAKRLSRTHPRRKFNDWLQRLDEMTTSLARSVRKSVRDQALVVRNLADRLGRVRPANLLRQRREVLTLATERLRELARHRLTEWKNRHAALEGRLRLLGPEQVLARGYSITTDAESGAVLRDAAKVKPAQRIMTRLKQGLISSRVTQSQG